MRKAYQANAKLVITTSRRPTQRIREFCRDLQRVIPNSIRMNRGKLSMDGLRAKASELGADSVLIVEREKGGPGRITLMKSDTSGLWSHTSVLALSHIRTRREFESKGRGQKIGAIVAAPSLNSRGRDLVTEISDFLGLSVVESFSKLRCVIDAYPHNGEVEFVVRIYPEGKEVGPSFTIGYTCQKASRE